jgi:hypothetical protein
MREGEMRAESVGSSQTQSLMSAASSASATSGQIVSSRFWWTGGVSTVLYAIG